MRITKYAKSKYCMMNHNRFKLFFTIIKRSDDSLEAHSISTGNLVHTDFKSRLLKEKTARTLGEMLIKLADLLKEK